MVNNSRPYIDTAAFDVGTATNPDREIAALPLLIWASSL